MRMNKKTMLLIIPAIALLACCIVAICVICIPSSYEVYTKQIQTAEKYLADKDYDGAIKYYEMAKNIPSLSHKKQISYNVHFHMPVYQFLFLLGVLRIYL